MNKTKSKRRFPTEIRIAIGLFCVAGLIVMLGLVSLHISGFDQVQIASTNLNPDYSTVLPQSASDINFYAPSYGRMGHGDFLISEADFTNWAPVFTGVAVDEISQPVGVTHITGNARGVPITDGFRVKSGMHSGIEYTNNGGRVATYDRASGRAFYRWAAN